ncbi:hypothetical protein NB689_000113 [Xanthomonas sacchari]|nr:hypothetical protein [Xanthomonas sacchari]
MAEMRQRHAHVGLGTAHLHLQPRRLQQPFVAGRAQAQQQFAEADDAGNGHGGRVRAAEGTPSMPRNAHLGQKN